MPKTIIKVPFNAIDIYKFEETENELILLKGSLFLIFQKTKAKKRLNLLKASNRIRFDKKTKEAV